MNIEIQETPIRRRKRFLWKIGFIWFAVFGVVLLMFLFVLFMTTEVVTLDNYIMLVIGTSVSLFSFYIYKTFKVVGINLITDRSITLIDGKKKLEIKKDDVLYAYIHGRHLISKNYAIYLRVKNKRILSVKFFLFGSDPQNDLIEIFKKMNIKLKGLI